MTDAERQLWKHLRLRNIDGFKFRRQHTIGLFIVDFVCLEAWLVIEIDGGQHADARQYDASRTAAIEKERFRVLRFWNNEVLENLDGVLKAISDALREN
jgi:very-short-patch-repair endonuclease